MATVTEKLRFLLEADASGAVRGFEKVGKTADRELLRAQSRMDKVGGSLTKFGAGAVAASGLVGAGLFKAANAFEDTAIAAGKFSDATGVAVEDASRWIEVAGDMGVEAGAVESSLGKLNKTISASPELLRKFGVEVERTATGAVDVNATFLNVIDRLNAIEDPARRAEAATALLGRGWQSMAELIGTGSDQLRQSLADVSDAKVIDQAELDRAKEFRAAMDTLGDAAQDLAISLGQGAAPVIGALATAAGDAMSAFSSLNAMTDGTVGQVAAVGAVALAAVGGVTMLTGKIIQLRQSFTALPMAAKGVAGAVGAVAIAYMAYEQTKSKAITSSEELVAAMKAERDGQQQLADEMMVTWLMQQKLMDGQATQMDSAAKGMEAYGLSAAEVVKALRDGVVPAVDASGASAEVFRMAWAELALVYGKSKSDIETTTQAVEDLGDATGYAADTAVDLQDPLKAIGKTSENVAKWVDQMATAQERANAAFQTAVDTVFSLPEAEDAYAAALESTWAATVKLNEAKAKKDGAAEIQAARDLEAAYRNQAEAAGALAVQQSGVTDETEAAAIKQQAMIAELEKVRASVAPGSPLYKEISGYIALLRSIPKTANTKVTVTKGPVPSAKYDSQGNIIGFGATGGIVTRPTMAVIGEAGPEAVVPLSKMPGASPLPAAGMGGANINITVNAGIGSDGHEIGRLIAEELRRYERRAGTSWRAA